MNKENMVEEKAKPKVELIKRAKTDGAPVNAFVPAEAGESSGEKRKVIVVKKKPSVTGENNSSAENRGAVPVKSQPRVTVTVHPHKNRGAKPVAAKPDESLEAKEFKGEPKANAEVKPIETAAAVVPVTTVAAGHVAAATAAPATTVAPAAASAPPAAATVVPATTVAPTAPAASTPPVAPAAPVASAPPIAAATAVASATPVASATTVAPAASATAGESATPVITTATVVAAPPVASATPVTAATAVASAAAVALATTVAPAAASATPVTAPAAPVPPQNAAPQAAGTPGAVPPRSARLTEVTSITMAARPKVAAGRVGGRFVGPRPPAENRSSPVIGRSMSNYERAPGTAPGSAAVGGRGGDGARHGWQGRQGGGGQGGQRGPFRPGTGQGGPRPFGGGQAGNGQRPFVPGSRPGGRPGSAPTATPMPSDAAKSSIKKSFKAKKTIFKKKEQEMEEKLLQTKKKITHIANPIPKSIDIMEVVSVSDLARKLNLKASDLIGKLMGMGMMVTINQQIDSDTAILLAAEFGAEVKIVSLYEETLIDTGKDAETDKTLRPPVVTVMGHVDHGKTKLLDAIRSTNVTEGEAGGITQHIGAYTVKAADSFITFLDTPGHEAFTRMRARGAQVTDIVVLVVAADDGVMPQTVEAINHAREAKVPIIVALNKIDKPEANPDRVRSQLSDMGLAPEEWGGQNIFVPISAKKKEGIEDLMEAILLQSEMLDLKAVFSHTAEGKIIESRIDQGRGIVATVLIQRGTLKIGDSFVAGVWPGKVRALFDDKGARVDEATPSMPVEVLGFEGIPNAGDPLQVVSDEKEARGYAVKRQELKRFEDAKNVRKITLDNLYDTINEGEIQELKVVIKGDVQGSVEAIRSSLEELSTREVRLSVIQALPGAINEGDVDLASASNAIVIGFNVRPTPKAKALATEEKVDIRKYNVIYRVVEEMKQAMEGLLKPDIKEDVIGTVEVREVFKISRGGTIAGCFVSTGTVKRSASINLLRDSVVLHTGKIASLRRFKDDVKEVTAGYECGIALDSFEDLRVGDQFEVFEIIEVARKLEQKSAGERQETRLETKKT
jgi:translation initiation factor IF-2